MKTNLAYIDAVIDREVETRAANASVPDSERVAIRKKAQTSVAGFKVFDEAKEREMLDSAIKKRMEAIDAFRKDRAVLRDKFGKLGITPLAIVPREAWNTICIKAQLYRFKPDSENRVRISRNAFVGLEETRRKSHETVVTEYAEHNRTGFLDKLFPNYAEGDGHRVTLVLPAPPDDVVETLIKAKSLALHVAAVGEAISFVETPAEMVRERNRLDEEERKYQEWLKNDPIVYHEGTDATAIIAQFGDFPIEQEVIDFVVGSDALIPDKKPVETIMVNSGIGSLTSLSVSDAWMQQRMWDMEQRMRLEQERMMYGSQSQSQSQLVGIGRTTRNQFTSF